ncbi:MAG: divalent metal cation transporter [Planctomycetota bacterium]|nr:MAG: divalent metal cation transporter [Planctomycetota bacterium]
MGQQHKRHYKGFFQALGPGILFAGAAIGGSHIVQSTKAGAIYGFALLWVVILANLMKYPFFRFMRQYTASTGETIIQGYHRQGRWALWLFLIISTISAVLNIAAVTVVTGFLASNLLPCGLSLLWWCVIIGGVCVVLLAVGHYPALDLAVKVIVTILAVSTIIAFLAAVCHSPALTTSRPCPPIWNAGGIVFLLALMGWMPAPIDVGAWPTLWALERKRQTGHLATMRETMVDFHTGYIGAAVLAVAFLGLGAIVMFDSGQTPAASGAKFITQFINLYTDTLGQWSRYFIAAAAFTCMFSTTLTCFDGYTRTVHDAFCLAVGRKNAIREDVLYWVVMGVFFASAIAIILGIILLEALVLVPLITTAMLTAFLTAPIVAWLTWRVIRGRNVPSKDKPRRAMRLLARAGIIFLTGFAILFIYSQLAEKLGWPMGKIG